MLKKILVAALLALPLLYGFTPSSPPPTIQAAEEIEVQLYGQPMQLEAKARLADGVTLVPLRSLAEALGASVQWNNDTATATLTKDGTTVQITVNENQIVKNGRALPIDGSAQLIDNVTMVPVRVISESFDTMVSWDAPSKTVFIDKLQDLPIVGSYDNMQTIAKNIQSQYGQVFDQSGLSVTTDIAVMESSTAKSAAPAAPVAAESKAQAAGDSSSTDYSKTNVQVEGVDEADIVKTDGTYLYQVNRNRVIVAAVNPADQMRVTSSLDFKEQSFTPQELYVDDRYLIVIGSSYTDSPVGVHPMPMPMDQPMVKRIMPIRYGKEYTKALVYDITDKTKLKAVREVELEGHYMSSRKIGSALYLTTNKYMNHYTILQEKADNADLLPAYRDTATNNEYQTINYDNIRYFPDSVEMNYMLIAGFDLELPNKPASVSAYLGSGQNLYASDKNLYVTVTRYQWQPHIRDTAVSSTDNAKIAPTPVVADNKSVIYKFRLDQGTPRYLGQGEVPGTILNQFSLDEHESYLRIATTTGEVWRTDEHTSKNHIYVLDEALKVTGKIENIAPGEKIYSARFMGKRAYMVTFRTVDPLFAIDLSNPNEPKILGKLKIPGYSDYLHPYDENHLIGFGKDAIEVSQKNMGNAETMAYYQGMKIALFDVTDVSNPIEKFKESIGDRGTHSELLNNHKALLFSKEKNLLSFPVTVMEVQQPNSEMNGIPAYGEFAFQGAYVYQLDVQKGFNLRGKITHLQDEDYTKSGKGWYNSDLNIQRILYIDDTLYTLSPGKIKANALTNLQEQGSLIIP